MKVTYHPDREVTPAAVLEGTGQPLESWFAALDERGGVAQGRKALSDYLFKERKVDAWWTATLAVEYEKARGAMEKDSFLRGYAICVTKSVAAPPAKVYEVLLNAGGWMGGKAKADVREGGGFDDGDGHQGIFKRLAPSKTMKFTWTGKGHQSVEEVEIKLTATGLKTSIVLNHSRLPDRAAADGMRAAWSKMLDLLREKLS